jgi:hypothetical protein
MSAMRKVCAITEEFTWGIFVQVATARRGDARDCVARATMAAALKIPALRVGDEEIAKCLHARHRFQLFRIDEVGIERDGLRLAE